MEWNYFVGLVQTNLFKWLASGRCSNFESVIFEHMLQMKFMIMSTATGHIWWLVNIGSGNGLVVSGNKPLPEPMLTKCYDAIWRH